MIWGQFLLYFVPFLDWKPPHWCERFSSGQVEMISKEGTTCCSVYFLFPCSWLTLESLDVLCVVFVSGGWSKPEVGTKTWFSTKGLLRRRRTRNDSAGRGMTKETQEIQDRHEVGALTRSRQKAEGPGDPGRPGLGLSSEYVCLGVRSVTSLTSSHCTKSVPIHWTWKQTGNAALKCKLDFSQFPGCIASGRYVLVSHNALHTAAAAFLQDTSV